MTMPNIKITNILGSQNITEDTPIIIVYVPKKYLIRYGNSNIYQLNLAKIYKINLSSLNSSITLSIKNYIPLGQLYIADNAVEPIKVYMANTTIIPTTRNYQQINKNIWIGIIKSKDKTSRSLGTIMSHEKPTDPIPVFPRDFLIKVDAENKEFRESNIYSHESYGTWILNKHKFNGVNYTMFDIDGKERIVDTNDEYNLKAYYTTQGNINDPLYELVSPTDTVWHRSGKKIILKEADEPWFLNPEIVGPIVYDNPHKITGMNIDTGASHLQVDEFTNRFTDSPMYGDVDEMNQIFRSDCVNVHDTSVKSYGHSRKDLYDKCLGIERFDQSNQSNDDELMNFNNIIMIIMCIIIIILLAYRTQSNA